MKKRIIIFLLFMINGTGLLHIQGQAPQKQSKYYNYVPICVDYGFLFPKISTDTTSTWSRGNCNSLHLRSGIGTLYDKRFGIQAEGGVLYDQYIFQDRKGGSRGYAVWLLRFSLSATPYILFPLPNKTKTVLHIGMGAGYTHTGSDVFTKVSGDLTITTAIHKADALTLAPEIGFTGFYKRVVFDLVATYNYQNVPYNTIRTTIQDNNGKFTLTDKGNYFAVKLRWCVPIHQKPKKKSPPPDIYKPDPAESIVYNQRSNSVIRKYHTRHKYVTLEFYEKNKVDHDSISVSVNGKYILVNHGLTNEHVKIEVPLEKGINTITVYALNEGDIPPNTATCLLKYGRRKEEFLVQTGHKKNESVEIEVK